MKIIWLGQAGLLLSNGDLTVMIDPYLSHSVEKVNPAMFRHVKSILDKNKSERHLRGGEATKQKYKKMRGEA